MFLSCSSFTEKGISFIQKNCGRSIVSSQLKGDSGQTCWSHALLVGCSTWNRIRINFSLSPRHLLAREEQRTLKKVVWNLAATACENRLATSRKTLSSSDLCQHGLACPRRAKEQEAADRVGEHAGVAQGGKDVGEAEGQGDAIMQ